MQNIASIWSVVSTILNVLLIVASIWLYWKAKSAEDKLNAQVKVWMQDANGLSLALQRIVSDNLAGRYHSTNDVCNAVYAVQSSAAAMYQGLYEERCVTEQEYKERQKKIMAKIDAEQLAVPSQAIPTDTHP